MPKSLACWLAACLLTSAVSAQPVAEAPIPPALKDWRAWALKDLEYRGCPFLASRTPGGAGDFVCAWPGRLALSAGGDGATFAIRWRVEAPAWIALPGDAEHWPQQVTVNGQRAPVLARDDRPELQLAAGTYDITGRIPWRERPQTLAVPAGIGLITLIVDARPIAPVQRDGNEVTLGRSMAAAPEADSINVRVYRKLADGIPARLVTQLVVAVAGQAREEALGPALPAGFVPVALAAPWPARLDGDNRLHVQVQPGTATVTLEARAAEPVAAITARLPAPPWPAQEIWSYEPAPHLRVTTASGPLQLDPRQAGVPQDWQSLAAFAIADGGKLAIEQRSRGSAPDEANRLTLQREAWLDFSGNGWFARDRLTGTMAEGWRFDVAAPYVLEQASAGNADNEALLITRGATAETSGVEWRLPRVDLAAAVRIDTSAKLAVAGWQQAFDGVQATLHLPFGYKLLAAPGADAANGSWASAWTLLDAFICAIVILLAWRLLGVAGAVAAAAFLLLGYQEAAAPLWSLIAALGLALVARALPDGKLVRVAIWARRAAFVALALIALPFMAGQVRFALYPQLEGGAGYAATDRLARQDAKPQRELPVADRVVSPAPEPAPLAMEESVRLNAPAAPPPAQPASQAALGGVAKSANVRDKDALSTIVVTGSRIDRSRLVDHYSETTIVQTGRGAPSWNLGSTAWLSWTGPVLATQNVRLVIAPPWLVRPLRIVLVALLGWLLWQVFRRPQRGAPPRAAALATGVLALGLIVATPAAQAQAYPSAEMLQQLRQRLSEAPKCAPACAMFAEAQVAADGDAISVALDAQAGERVALPLPGDPASASLRGILLDGSAADGVVRDEQGTLWIAVGRGVHRIQLDFAASGNKVGLAFPLKPARALFQGRGWEATGLADDRLLTETLTLARARAGDEAAVGDAVQQFPTYVRVHRHLSLGLEWSALTMVERLAPAKGGFDVDVPLLGGEHVTTSGVKVQNGKAQVAIADEEGDARWDSTIDKGDTLSLTAPALTDRAEVWSVLVSPTWHVEFSGVPSVGANAGGNANDFREFEFHPLPGETLTLRVTRPAPVQGAARAIDAASLGSEAGQRASTHVLRFSLRASQGGEQAVRIPKDAEVLAVSRDGIALNLRPVDGSLSLPVAPGTQRYEVRFRAAEGAALRTTTPDVSLGLPAANVALSLQLPGDRWLLAAFGPTAGPAVLYWGELLVMIGVAWVLARTRRTRLGFGSWLLLGLGFSTFSWTALLVVVAWLFALDWRARAELPAQRWAFNLLQASLVLLTLIAVVALVSAIPQGLLGQPDMHVTGNGSYANSLRWFADRSADTLPTATAVSVPLWMYKALMLGWAVWLANALIGWLRDGFAAWTRNGYWRGRTVSAARSGRALPAEDASAAGMPPA